MGWICLLLSWRCMFTRRTNSLFPPNSIDRRRGVTSSGGWGRGLSIRRGRRGMFVLDTRRHQFDEGRSVFAGSPRGSRERRRHVSYLHEVLLTLPAVSSLSSTFVDLFQGPRRASWFSFSRSLAHGKHVIMHVWVRRS